MKRKIKKVAVLGAGVMGAKIAAHVANAGIETYLLDIAPRELQTPEGLAAFHKAETEKWWPVIKAANIKVE